jgi:hypothetical protein
MRVLHIALLINFGAYVTLPAPILVNWHAAPTAVFPVWNGWRDAVPTLLWLAAGAWSRGACATRAAGN